MTNKRIRAYLEVAPKKTFAVTLDWPGWARSGKTPELALEALGRYAGRYAEVVAPTGIASPTDALDFDVVETVAGNTTTEFGAPAMFVAADREAVGAEEARRTAVLVQACWDALARTAAVSPESLRKGPRGGGRDRSKMLDHVVGAEAAYARKIGIKHKPPTYDDEAAIRAMRADILQVIGEKSDGELLVPKGWPVAYTARRVAWHATDHAWEMEDRREPAD